MVVLRFSPLQVSFHHLGLLYVLNLIFKVTRSQSQNTAVLPASPVIVSLDKRLIILLILRSSGHAEPEPGFHQRWRRASEHSQAKEQGHHEHQEHSKEHAKVSHQAKEQRQESSSHSAHAKHGKFFRSGNSEEFEGEN